MNENGQNTVSMCCLEPSLAEKNYDMYNHIRFSCRYIHLVELNHLEEGYIKYV